MKIIKDQEFGGERPLYTLHDAQLKNVTIHLGESSIKESGNIEAEDCTFEGKYVFWECKGFKTTNCLYRESARSSLWYSENGTLVNCRVEAPKLFRRMKGIRVEGCTFTNALETLWDCDQVVIRDSRIENADYLGMHTDNVRIENFHLDGNYAFRYSKNLRLIRCHITGEQPLCYCENLYMEDCTMGEDANLAFEYSTIEATIRGKVHSIKNPTSGSIEVDSVGEIIIDENQKSPADCKIKVKG